MALIVDFAHKPQRTNDQLAQQAAVETERSSVSNDIGSVLNRMRKTALDLLTAEVQLAKNELQEEFTAEVLFTRRIILASALIIVGITLLIIGVLIVISKFIPLWLGAIIFGATLLSVGTVSLMTAWKRHASISTISGHLKESLDWSDLTE